MFEKIGGIPTHPLTVHAPIVLIPLAIVAIIAYVAISRRRLWLAGTSLFLALAATATSLLATASGESLEEHYRNDRPLPEPALSKKLAAIHEHSELGETVRNLSFALLIGLVVLLLLDRQRQHVSSTETESANAKTLTTSSLILGIILVLIGGITLYYLFEAGHTGAVMVWKD